MTTFEDKLREILLPVLGLDSVEEIDPKQALVDDLKADSLDFVEIVFLVEKTFGVSIETSELVSGGALDGAGDLFDERGLTKRGLDVIRENIPEQPERFSLGMTKVGIFRIITVRDLATIIQNRMDEE